MTSLTLNSPLRWAGSKRSLLPKMRVRLPQTIDHYVEPFVGSGCLYFTTKSSSAALSDFNPELIGFYQALQNNSGELIAAFDNLRDLGEAYYEIRKMDSLALSEVDRAARFLYLNRFAFNGVYRTNRQGEFNVPRGVRTGALPTTSELLALSERLQGVEIFCADYRDALHAVKSSDFVYLDPPYRNVHRKTYGEYGYESFGSDDDVVQLGAELERLTNIGAKVLLSFNDDAELADSLANWTVERIERRRSVAGNAARRTSMAGEILAWNYDATPESVAPLG
jgi:DNA adenine methylase